MVIAVTSGSADPLWLERSSMLRDCELIVVDAALSSELLKATAPREVQVVRGAVALRACIASTARRLAGRSVGLVLSGGGARGLAHLGVLAELEQTGIVIGRYGGASMGAIVSGLAARGHTSSEISAMCQRLMLDNNPSNDYTVPAYALVRGTKARRGLLQAFGNHRIEELERRWFCVASDLVGRELIVHRTGLMADAVYSSMALPGVYPPIPTTDGRLLVDGGVMDNLPVETMAKRAEGPIIAVDVSQRLGLVPPSGRPGLQRLGSADASRPDRRWPSHPAAARDDPLDDRGRQHRHRRRRDATRRPCDLAPRRRDRNPGLEATAARDRGRPPGGAGGTRGGAADDRLVAVVVVPEPQPAVHWRGSVSASSGLRRHGPPPS